MSELRTVVENFTNQLAQVIEAQIMDRARQAVAAALGNGHVPARRGRPPKSAALVAWTAPKKPRKKAPKQLCPVPGCTNPAAPVFGMVCSKHKDVAKSKIKKYRLARKAKKTGEPAPKAAKAMKATKATKKTRRIAAKSRKKIIKASAAAKKAAPAAEPAAAPAA